MKYNNQYIIDQLAAGEKLKYVFFWGHTEKKDLVTKACFSQWYESSFEVEGITYPTTEHWMMSKKAALFEDEDIYQKIINCQTPGEAKDLGRQVKGFKTAVWKKHRMEIVVNGNFHKFSQNEALGTFLKNTKKRVLVEASPLDSIWGIGMAEDHPDILNASAWKGANLLGFALMEARDLLRNAN